MFSSLKRLQERQGKSGSPRSQYLNELVREFQSTKDCLRKGQVLANLANFAYDPINYDDFRKLNIIDLFLDVLDDTESPDFSILQEFAIGGLSNLCNDPQFRLSLDDNDAIQLFRSCLESENVETVLSALSVLYWVSDGHEYRDNEVETLVLTRHLKIYLVELSETRDSRLKNMVKVILEDRFGIILKQ